MEEDVTLLADHRMPSIPASDSTFAGDLAKAMNQLTPEHREILLLVSVEELNYREISDELRIPLGTVMSRLARARDNLRAILQGNTADVLRFPQPKAAP